MSERLNLFGVKISNITPAKLVKKIEAFINANKPAYVCFSNVHTVVFAREDEAFGKITINSDIACPDGMPLVWLAKKKGFSEIEKCSGPDMMELLLELSNEKGYTSYFYGSTQETLELLRKKINNKYPNAKIAGMFSPPYRKLTEEEDNAITDEINSLKPDFIWVGLGAPKQEIWMHEHKERIERGVMFGVGAAFNFMAGNLERAPLWMQEAGFEWMYRLLKEPGRLWKRYFYTNIKFIYYCLRDAK